jgi:UDP-2,4-diacetamido-2,4,6-trideoxy-beta-L-altropyranose hydrolase
VRVAIRVDAGPLIGGGHAMRCLTLADALGAGGAEVTFVTAAMPEALRQRITSAGHRLVDRPALLDLDRTGRNWHEPPLGGEVQIEDVTATEAGVGSVEWMIVDHYLLDARWHSAARRFADKLLVIDDLANRTYQCDLLLDQTFGRSALDYRQLVPPEAKVLAGSRYALLRSEFAIERPAALERRQTAGPIRQILVSVGTTDPGGVSARIVEDVLRIADCAVDVVLGPLASRRDRLRGLAEKHPNLTLHVNSSSMSKLMRDADLAIGAAGATSWERCCLGLPAVTLVLAENQHAGAIALAEAGAALALERADGIGASVEQLIGDPDRLARMSAAAFAIVDGLGTDRVVGAMLGQVKSRAGEIRLRPAKTADAEPLWLWRNDPDTRRYSRSTEPIAWQDHLRWLSFTDSDPSRRILIAECGAEAAGTVRFDPAAGGGEEISITVAPEQRGTGVGAAMLKAACAQARTQRIYASVREGNEASRRLFESCGFKPVESAERGFLRYALFLEQRRRKQA